MSGLTFLAVVHQHSDSVTVLRIVFSIMLAVVFFSGIYMFRIRKRLFDRDPQVTGDHYAARNLRLWQVILVWVLAMDLLIMALIKL
jgi:formate hydrogenlyase subunit 3/multisubunit Na+/H+ antiporter MnhD subunit